MQLSSKTSAISAALLLCLLILASALSAQGQTGASALTVAPSRLAAGGKDAEKASVEYRAVQQRLARGWNTWDVHSVATQVLLPEGLAIHVGLKHNSTLYGDAFLKDALIGRMDAGAEQVTPGAHSWDGSYTELKIAWRGHSWRVQSARDGSDLVVLASPLPGTATSALPSTIVFSVNFLWNRPGTVLKREDSIEVAA